MQRLTAPIRAILRGISDFGGRGWLIAALILAILAYSPVLVCDFISDDLFYIGENYLIRHPSNWWKLIDVPEDGVMGELRSGLLKHRNARDLFFALVYWTGGWNATAFHLAVLGLHLTAGALLYLYASTLMRPAAALIACTLFLVHPVHSEAVAYISAGKDALMTCAFLATLLLVNAGRRKGRSFLIAAYACTFAIAFYAKEVAVTLVGVLVLQDLVLAYRRDDRRPITMRAILDWVILAALALTMLEQRMSLVSSGVEPARPEIASPLFLIPFYLLRWMLPWNLQAEYRGGFPPMWDWLLASESLQLLLVGAICLSIAVLAYQRRGVALLAFGWFYAALSPVLHFVPFHTPAAEHYLYLPGAGMCLLLGHLAAATLEMRDARLQRAGLLLLILALATGTFVRTLDYRSDYHLYADASAKAPNNGRAEYGRIIGSIRAGRAPLAETIAAYEMNRRNAPGVPSFYYALGYLYEQQGDVEMARRRYTEAIARGSRPWEVYIAAARLEMDHGGEAAAERLLRDLLSRYPYHADGHLLLATLELRASPGEALRHFRRAAGLDLHAPHADLGADLARVALEEASREEFIEAHDEFVGFRGSSYDELRAAVTRRLLRKPSAIGSLEIL